jgi:hypothetical protein
MAARRLEVRSDTKFVLAPRHAAELLHRLWPHYAVLPAPLRSLSAYHTLYLDTPELDLFHAHRRGRRVRHKARIRHYLDRRISVLEVKSRLSELRTVKVSRERAYRDDRLTPEDDAFIAQHTGLRQTVGPQVWTRYRRVTLYGIETRERITVDLDFQVDMGPRLRRFEGLAILEVKQWPLRRATPVMASLRAMGSGAGWASKYCIGIAHTRPDVRVAGLTSALRDFGERVA